MATLGTTPPPPTVTPKKPEPAAFEQLVNLCPHIYMVSMDQPFRSLIQMPPADLAKLPGTPAVVMLAQTLSFLKTTNKLREPHLSDTKVFDRLHAVVRAAKEKKG